ncbi:hypothetical protein [Leeia sp.]|uniref:hypothetical protein n=1 Tax=Leeia sp. TaxID=2884678 RepID=UPI0035AE6C8B
MLAQLLGEFLNHIIAFVARIPMRILSQRHVATLLAGLSLTTAVWASKPEVLAPVTVGQPPLQTGIASATGECPVLQTVSTNPLHLPLSILPPTAPTTLQAGGHEQYAMGMFYKRGLGLPRPKGK